MSPLSIQHDTFSQPSSFGHSRPHFNVRTCRSDQTGGDLASSPEADLLARQPSIEGLRPIGTARQFYQHVHASLELFAGAGGLGLGLQNVGFHPEALFEREKNCKATLHLNKQHGWHTIKDDVCVTDFRVFEDKVTLVSGGPPCQPFSLGGKHKAYDDERDMFPQAIRAVREVRPQAFIFENVRGITRKALSDYFRYIQLQLEHPEVTKRPDEQWTLHYARLEQHHMNGHRHGLNYRVVTQLVNAADYGVPQRRERVFIVGFRDDLGIRWCAPRPTHSQQALAADKRTGAYWDRVGVSEQERPMLAQTYKAASSEQEGDRLPWITVQEAIASLPEPDRDGGQHDHKLQHGARSYPGHTGSPLHEPAKTLKAGVHGVPGGENMLLRPDGSVRYFTIRESARLQTFPDEYVFHGSWSEAMRQLGNAVPVRLAEAMGQSVYQQLEAGLPLSVAA